MARPTQRPTSSVIADDEIDLFELIKFVVDIRRYWIGGGLALGGLALIYALLLFPTTMRQQTVNDIGLNTERLNVLRTIMPAMIQPLETEMQNQGLADLYRAITRNPNFLTSAVTSTSGVDLKDKNLDLETKGKVETIRILLKGHEAEELQQGLKFMQNNVRALSQYLAIKSWVDQELRNAKLKRFNTEAQINNQILNQERLGRQLTSYAALTNEAKDAQDLQIILNLSDQELDTTDPSELDKVTEFSGVKYLPLANRLVALKSELADLREAVRLSENQIRALILSQQTLNELAETFREVDYNGDTLDMSPFIQVITAQRSDTLIREEIAALDALERTIIGFEADGLKFNNRLPAVTEKKGRFTLVVIGGLIGGFGGFLLGAILKIAEAYRRRYR